MNWIVAIPAWGERCSSHAIKTLIPSCKAALKFSGHRAEFIVYTDEPDKFGDVTLRPAPLFGDKYRKFGDVHRHVIKHAAGDSRIMLCTADMVISRESFAACDDRFEDGKKAIVVGPSRVAPPEIPKPGMKSGELLDWSMRHAHPFTLETFAGGNALTPTTMRFTDGENITLRGFHLHPLAIVKDRELKFSGTADQDLLSGYKHDEIHVVTDRDEMAVAEMSPKGMGFPSSEKPITTDDIVIWATRNCAPINWWLATHRIQIAGNKAPDDTIWEKALVGH